MEKEYQCPNPECDNYAFEPGVCSGCGSTLEEVEMIGTEDTIEGLTSLAGVGQTPHSKRIQELMDELPKGRECPKCGMSMIHYRLKGYQCPRCD